MQTLALVLCKLRSLPPCRGISTTTSSRCGLAEQGLGDASSGKPTHHVFMSRFIWVPGFSCAAVWLRAIPQHCLSGCKHPQTSTPEFAGGVGPPAVTLGGEWWAGFLWSPGMSREETPSPQRKPFPRMRQQAAFGKGNFNLLSI